jgi:hypothetical protein
MVLYGNGMKALFLDRARAEQFAVGSHGLIVELFTKEELG